MNGSLVRRWLFPLLLLVALALGTAACSPEGSRTRGGGDGADIGNRDENIELHGDEGEEQRIYYDTPIRRPVEAS